MNIFVILYSLIAFASKFQLALALGQHWVKFSGKKVTAARPPNPRMPLRLLWQLLQKKCKKRLCSRHLPRALERGNEIIEWRVRVVFKLYNNFKWTWEGRRKDMLFFSSFLSLRKKESTCLIARFPSLVLLFRRPAWFAMPYTFMMISVKTFGPAEIDPEILSEIEKILMKLKRNGGSKI